jgi:hypothetical protein
MAKLSYLFFALPLATLGSATLYSKSGQAKSTCPITQAVYSQPENKGVTAGFALQGIKTAYASDLAFWVKANGQTYWFGFESPNGYGGTYIYQRLAPDLIAPVTHESTPNDQANRSEDEPKMLMFDAFHTNMKAYTAVPQAMDKAPAYLYARELGPLFHYAHNGNTYIEKEDKPVRINIAMWQQTGCAPAPHK